MEFSTKRVPPEKRATPCIAVGVYAGHKLSAAAWGSPVVTRLESCAASHATSSPRTIPAR